MHRPLGRLILCASLAACAALSAAAQGGPPPPPPPLRHVEESEAAWKRFAPAGGGFAVLMPGTPVEQTTPIRTQVGELTNHIFILPTQLSAYFVSYVEFPETVTDPARIKEMLDRGRDGGLETVGATLHGEKEIRLGDHYGREWALGVPGKFVGQARSFWVSRRFYQVLVLMEEARPGDSAATLKLRADATHKFLNSFALADERAGARRGAAGNTR